MSSFDPNITDAISLRSRYVHRPWFDEQDSALGMPFWLEYWEAYKKALPSIAPSPDEISEKQRWLATFREEHGIAPMPQEEWDRREEAAVRLRKGLIRNPYYASLDSQDGMRYWRALYSAIVTSE